MNRVRLAVTAAFLAAVGLIAHGLLTPTVSSDGLYSKIDSVPGYPLDAGFAQCDWREGYGNPTALALFFPDAGYTSGRYAIVKACANVADAGADAGDIDAGEPLLPPGFDRLPIVFGPGRTDTWDGGPQIEVWLQGSPTAPFQCACAKDATCLLADGGAAPLGLTLAPGTWSGAGCFPKVCVEWAGVSSWPSGDGGCPQ